MQTKFLRILGPANEIAQNPGNAVSQSVANEITQDSTDAISQGVANETTRDRLPSC